MTSLDDFAVYRYYLALKLHFTTDKYDVIKQKGRVRATRAAFEKRRDTFYIKKLAKTLNDKDVVNFLVANFVSGDKWGGVFDANSEKIFKDWQKKVESLSYLFRSDLDYLELECEKRKQQFIYIFETGKNEHPLLLQAYLGGNVSIETLIILNDLKPYIDNFDSLLYNDIIWNDVSRLCKKYKPFLHYNKSKLHEIYANRR